MTLPTEPSPWTDHIELQARTILDREVFDAAVAQRVAELRADGYNIETTYVTLTARGRTTRYAR